MGVHEGEESTLDQDKRLAALLKGDDDDDEEEGDEDDRLQELLQRGEASERKEEEEPQQIESKKTVITVINPPASSLDTGSPPLTKTSSGVLLDRITSRLHAMHEGGEDNEEVEEELDFRPPSAEDTSTFAQHIGNDSGAASLRLRASRHDARAPTEIVVEIVWENQCMDSLLTEGAKRLAAMATSASSPSLGGAATIATWRPCRGNSRWGGDSKPPLESPTQPRLGLAFARLGARPNVAKIPDAQQLPDTTWRWLSPWQLDSRVHGSDRLCLDDENASPEDWLYANSWPSKPDQPYVRTQQAEHKVRCRRWIRPRERLGANTILDSLLVDTNEASLETVFLRRQNSTTGLIDLDAVATDLGLCTPNENDLVDTISNQSLQEEIKEIPVTPSPSTDNNETESKQQQERTLAKTITLNESARFTRSAITSSFSALLKTAQYAASSVSRETPPSLHSDPSSEAGVVLDFVWEQQRYAPSLRGQGSWTARALIRRQPYEASRPELVSLFKRYDGPPEPDADVLDSALPDGWRWISPWVIDSLSFGADRTLTDALNVDDDFQRGTSNIVDGWIYAFDWPASNHGYKPKPDNRCFVRCRRWVRPRERIPPGEEDRITGGGRYPPPPPAHDTPSPLSSPNITSSPSSSQPKLFS
mmetsp:Transcript_14690/g.22138  ORF Transcript_14690/g.22138 Transcript_14690/m.22138 type:complete len:648 (-) Transcript_14690:701-2644(-)